MEMKPGLELLHYRLIEKIGEGGMGVVWKATDTTLDRDVAIKVLPEALSSETDRLARFEREAKLLASLNHPNIAGIFGLHESDGTRFIAMELIAGEDLAEVIARGPISVDRAMEIAQQIADALEVAHEQGVVHRDLKPANIKVTPEGKIKVLDFGLAKAFQPDPSSSEVTPTMSPTLTSAGTVAGMVLGTAAYMAPEQARGYATDKRADIWAFGCVLYEMLTGKMAFPGDTISDTLAAVLKLEPDWEALPEDTPPLAHRLLRRCLEKDVRKRLRDIGEARIRIDRSLSGEAVDLITEPSSATIVTEPAKPSRLPWLLAVAALLIGFAAVAVSLWQPENETNRVMRFEVNLSDELETASTGSSITFSPDGERLAYIAGNPPMIHIRQVGQFEGSKLSGTENASQPFFSPDGQWIGFFSGSDLKKISVLGGATMNLAKVQEHRGATWNDDGTIIYAPNVTSGLMRIRDAGGEPEILTDVGEDGGIRSHRWPRLLPGGKAVLFTVQPSGQSFDEARIEVMDLKTKARQVVASGGSYPIFSPSGHVTYIHEGTMFSIPFDADSLEVKGSPVPVVERISYDERNGGAQVDISPQGHLVYISGSTFMAERTVAWIDPDGTVTTVVAEPRDYACPRLSPDGNRLAIDFSSSTPEEDVWIHEFARGTMTRLTFAEPTDLNPVWTPDGTKIAFSSVRDASVPNLYWKLADGSGEAELLVESDLAKFITSFSPDGAYLMFQRQGGQTNWDLLTLRMEDMTIETFLETEFTEGNGRFSPDGRWIAYNSNESGKFEIYVRPFPAGGGKWQVSTNGGGYPIWSHDGSRIYYTVDSNLMMAEVSANGSTFRAQTPQLLVEGLLPPSGPFSRYDVAQDGRVIAVLEMSETTGELPRTMLALHWSEELSE